MYAGAVIALALALLALWMVTLALARARSARGAARRWNAGLLLLTVATAFASCVAPIVQLTAGFRAVAGTAPAEKAAVLAQHIEDTRPAMLLSLATLPVLGIGIAACIANRRRRKQRERERAVVDAF